MVSEDANTLKSHVTAKEKQTFISPFPKFMSSYLPTVVFSTKGVMIILAVGHQENGLIECH